MTEKITQGLLESLTEQAKASPRLRMNLDLRNSAEDKSQRMLNAIEPGSPLPIHRHTKSSETVVCLRGRLVEDFTMSWRWSARSLSSCLRTDLSSPSTFQSANGILCVHWRVER